MNEALSIMRMPMDAVLEMSDTEGGGSSNHPVAKRPKRASVVEAALDGPMLAVPAQTVHWKHI